MNLSRWLSDWTQNRRLAQIERQTRYAAQRLAAHGAAKYKARRDIATAALVSGGTVDVPDDSVVNRPWPQRRYGFADREA